MADLWHGLLANLGVMSLFLLVWAILRDWLEGLRGRAASLVLGFAMGVGAIALMVVPFEISPGVNFDMRNTLIGVAALFGGPVSGLVAAATAGAYRVLVGGAGIVAGLVSIAVTAFSGIIAHGLLKGRPTHEGEVTVYAVVLGCLLLACMTTLPASVRMHAFVIAGAPTFSITVISTMLAGIYILHGLRQRELNLANKVLRGMFDALPDSLSVKDLTGRYVIANPATAALTKLPGTADLVGKTDFDVYPDPVARRMRAEEGLTSESGEPRLFEQKIVRHDGSKVWVSTLNTCLDDEFGRRIGLISHSRDITAQKILEDALRRSQDRLADALAFMADGVAMFDRTNHLTYCNEQYLELFPLTSDIRIPGADLCDILRTSVERGEETIGDTDLETWIADRCGQQQIEQDRRLCLADGRWLHIRNRMTREGGMLSVYTDITLQKAAEDALQSANEQLSTLASTDGLTGLLNRRSLDQILDKEYRRSRRERTPLSLMMIDIDWFKRLNDTYGHLQGDDCLRRVSRCIIGSLRRPADCAGRYGGEEMLVVLPNTTLDGAIAHAEALRQAIRDENIAHVASPNGRVTVSIGVACMPPDSPLPIPEDLLLEADRALYVAKESGRDRVWGAPHEPNPARLTA